MTPDHVTSQPFSTEPQRWAALRARDPAADGIFFVSVRSTGVYCRPSCNSRPARPENIGFHRTAAEAERAGFRPCKRCRPDEPPRAERDAALVAAACRSIEASEGPLALDTLAACAGLSTHHFHRLFRRVAGVTPGAYAQTERARRVAAGLLTGERVTDAIYDAGFNSSGRFYEAADGILGMTPTAFRAGGAGQAIGYATASCTLGHVLVATTERGICAIQLGDDPAELAAELSRRFPRATRTESHNNLGPVLAQVVALVDRPASGMALPLDIQGTAFQRRVWEALRAIPAGQTRSYAEVAAAIEAPGAARAVAAACASNRIAVAIPCHRVVAADGSLSGYRWGPARKRQLLHRERA